MSTNHVGSKKEEAAVLCGVLSRKKHFVKRGGGQNKVEKHGLNQVLLD